MIRAPVAIVVLFALLAGACSRPSVELELITPRQPTDRSIAEDLAEFVSGESGIRIRLIDPPEGQSTLDALEAGYGDIAFASNDQPFRPEIATIIPLYPTVLHIVVRESLIAENAGEMLTGAKVYAGPIGSASRLLHEQFISDLGMDPATQTYLDSPQGTDPDVVVVFNSIAPERIPKLSGFRLMSFGSPDEIGKGSSIDRTILFHPRMRPFIIPVGTYGDLTREPVVTAAVDKLLVARSDMENPVAYDLIREILRLRPALSGNRPTIFHSLDDDIDDSSFTFPMHRGAKIYVDRDEPTLIERYSGVAEVAVTLFVALVSGLFAAVNIYRIRRKNRIDVFYAEVFTLRKAMDTPLSKADKADVIGKLHDLQKRAFDMLVDEKLAADESFRIFMALSNDAIHDLEELAPAKSDNWSDVKRSTTG